MGRWRGVFIAVEGIDGSGKSTVVKTLANALPGTYVTSEPSGSPIGRLIREWALRGGSVNPLVDALLFAADRLEHYEREIKPHLESGHVVLCERYVESSIAYQGAAGVEIEFLELINSKAPKPDLTIVLDVEPEEAIRRISDRHNVEKYERLDFLKRVRAIYLQRAVERGYPVIDASKSIDAVVEQVLKVVEGLLREKSRD